ALERRERLGPEHAEPPRLVEMVTRREARRREQLEQRLAGHRLGAERLVRPAGLRQLFQAHARLAVTVTVAPARSSSCENGQPACAWAAAVWRASSSTPSTRATITIREPTIWWP